jgi:potassium-transporting ATPase ATP-binding subunit
MSSSNSSSSIWTSATIRPALMESLRRLDPRVQARNPVMFVVVVGAALTTALAFQAATGHGEASFGFVLAIAVLLWLTVGFANFADAIAEGRAKAQAASLRGLRRNVPARKLSQPLHTAAAEEVLSSDLAKGDHFLVRAGETIAADGTVVEGVASVDESAITGESAPVIREAGGDFSAVTGGTRVLSDWLVVRVTSEPGGSFLDRMIAMVEGAKRRKTPNEIALTILLVALTLVFLLACATLLPFTLFAVAASGSGSPITLTAIVALVVCLIPTTIGALLSAIGVAGMGRMLAANVIATSGRAIEAAGDVDVLLLDKTGTITLGNRQASALMPSPGVAEAQLADAAQLASLADETPEGRSIVVLAKRYGIRERALETLGAHFVAFTAQTRMSGVDLPDRVIRKGSPDAIKSWMATFQGVASADLQRETDAMARRGSTPLWVAESTPTAARLLGVIELKDIVKGGMRERFAELRRMGIKTVMVTGDNPLTAAAIAAEAGVDDYLAEATPEAKLRLIRQHQSSGQMVAMTGDGRPRSRRRTSASQ